MTEEKKVKPQLPKLERVKRALQARIAKRNRALSGMEAQLGEAKAHRARQRLGVDKAYWAKLDALKQLNHYIFAVRKTITAIGNDQRLDREILRGLHEAAYGDWPIFGNGEV